MSFMPSFDATIHHRRRSKERLYFDKSVAFLEVCQRSQTELSSHVVDVVTKTNKPIAAGCEGDGSHSVNTSACVHSVVSEESFVQVVFGVACI